MANPWITHLKAFYAKNKGKMSYAQAMKAAKATYTKKGSTEPAKKTKKKRRKK
jgi:hypothetical protein